MSKLMKVLLLKKDTVNILRHGGSWQLILAGGVDDFTQFYFAFMIRSVFEADLSLSYHPNP